MKDLGNSIAIVGMSGRFPGAGNLEEFWRNLRAGVDSVRFFDDQELLALGVDPALIADPTYIKAASQPPDLDKFDAGFFGINHREAEILDPQQRVFLETCWEALEDAGYDPDSLGRNAVGVFGGATTSTYLLFNLLPNAVLLGTLDPLQLLVGNAGDSLATRVSYKLNLTGPSYTVQSACSTSAVAVHTACQSLLNGECDMALAGGVSINVHLLTGYRSPDGSVFARSGQCRAFDAGAEGILFGGGSGVVVLKRAEDAFAAGDNIRALILGSAVNNDGALKVGYTAPSVDGQAEVITEAFAAAGVDMDTISYIEGHGTGTRLGDPIEIQALTKAFRAGTERRQFIPLGSVKTNIGHLDVAAGIAGIIKTVLALEHREIPPNLHFDVPNPEIDFASSPVFVNTALRRWDAAADRPRRAGVSSFGFGGTNAHLVLEEAPAPDVTPPRREWHLLPLSARTEAGLEEATRRLADHLDRHPELDLADVEWTLQTGRRSFEHRRLAACRDRADAVRALESLDPARVWTAVPGHFVTPTFPFGGGMPAQDGLADLGRRWLSWETVDWRALYEGERRRRVSLPAYPFERRRYWIEHPGVAVPAAERRGAAATAMGGEAVHPVLDMPEEALPPSAAISPVLAMAAGSVQTLHPRPNLFNPYEPPRDEREGKVCRIWQEILGVEQVGVHDNFFQLGGHSLLATQVLSRVREEFGVEFPLQHLFSFPTAAELAEAIRYLLEEGAGEAREERARIPRSPIRESGEPLPLSFAQQRLWFLDQFEPGTPAFNVPAAIGLSGRLDIAALHKALNEVVRRHETLRSRFPSLDGVVAQEILPELEIPLPVLELAHLPEDERKVEERRLILTHTSRSFDLATGPLISAVLLRLAPEEHLLILVVHHIVTDGWSMGVLQVELTHHYRAALTGEAAPLPELPIQYLDFADWQRHHFQGEVLAAEIDYWRGKLGGIPFLDIRGDRPRPPVQTFRGEYEDFQLPVNVTRGLEALSQSEGASLFMVLLTGYKILLQRYSQQDDFGVGALIANRTRSEVEGLIGFFVNNLALRTDLGGNPTARELLGRVRETTLGAYEHQDIPFEKLLEELTFERDLSRSPVVQAMLNLLNFPAVYEELPGLKISSSGIRNDRANFDLSLWMAEGPESMVGWMEYNADLFDRPTARRMVGHLQRIFAAVATDPDRRIQDLPLLSDAERTQVLLDWNRTDRERPADTFVERFAAVAERHADSVAAVFQGESLTYRELDARANRWARVLAGRGVRPESLVAILAERSLDFLTGVLAVLKAGGAYLPLDPNQPAPRALGVLRQSGAGWLLSGNGLGGPLLAAAEEAGGKLPEVERLEIESLDGLGGDESPLAPAAGLDNLAYVIYTSGSTGLPKGAMLEHRGMLNHLLAKVEDLELTAVDVVAQNASQSFDISVWQLLSALAVGGRVHLYPDEVAHDPAGLLAAVQADEVTILEVVPSMLAAMLEGIEGSEGGGERPELTSLRWMIPTGEALPPELCRRWLALYPGVPLLNAYGPTECSDDVSHHPVRSAPEPHVVYIPIGKPVANTRLYLLDRELRPLPPGVAGEICVGGMGVGRGYLGDAEKTAQVFVPDPFADQPGRRMYRTGDLARWLNSGEIEFLGRVDFQVKVRGFRIEPGEIESIVSRHPAVHQAVVLALEEKGEKRLVGYAVPQAGQKVEIAELRSFVKERLPDYMVPAAFVVLDKMPLTPNGKVDRRALPPPVWGRVDGDEGYVAPRNEVEEALVELWKEILRVQRVGAFDNFFELGGHSLLATQLVSRIQQTFEIDLKLRNLFEAPTLAELALVIEELMIAKIDSLSEEELAELL
jgi:amino acid adenylation domain-containing protein